jgi:F-type H+-transporting ATPase subunit a
VEMIFEAMLRFVESVVGRNMAHRVFPMITTIFLFVLFNAWLALLPIYFSLGFKDASGDIKAHLLRSAGTDINMPLALALISFVFVEYMGLRVKGFHYLGKFFSLGNLFKFRIINLFVGFLELVSELVRIVSFTFRLFGNMMAGEILLVMVAFLVPFVAIDMVYGLELLVGLIQALIFAGLTLVFVSVAVAKNDH